MIKKSIFAAAITVYLFGTTSFASSPVDNLMLEYGTCYIFENEHSAIEYSNVLQEDWIDIPTAKDYVVKLDAYHSGREDNIGVFEIDHDALKFKFINSITIKEDKLDTSISLWGYTVRATVDLNNSKPHEVITEGLKDNEVFHAVCSKLKLK